MNKIIGTYLAMGLTMMEDFKTQSEQRKEQILVKWEESKKMPRKMKKRVRKELELDWSIACWNPFDDLNF
jgi:hypothetical protein